MKSIKHLLSLMAIVTFVNANAQASFEWANGTGGTAADYGCKIIGDNQDNSYSIGVFSGSADLDPGPGVTNYVVSGFATYVRKLDPNGNLLWVYVYDANSYADIVLDSNGDVIVAGAYSGTVDFDAGSGAFNLSSINGSNDVYVMKISSAGNFIWCRSIGGTINTHADGLTIDGQNNLLLYGRFYSTIDFDPGSTVMNVTASASNETYMLKLDSNGDFIWVKTFGTSASFTNPAYLGVKDVCFTTSGNICIAGSFKSIFDFDLGPSVNNMTSVGLTDIFLLSLDANGDFVFCKRIGGSDNDVPTRIITDHNDNIIIGGSFTGTLDFDPDTGVMNATSNGDTDCFILKLSSTGSFVWNMTFGDTGLDHLEGIDIDSYNAIYSTGRIEGDVDIDPGTGTYVVNGTTGDWDLYFQKLNANGIFEFGGSFVGPATEYADEINVNDLGSIYMSGEINQTTDFDPGAGVFVVTSNGLSDHYNVKLSQCLASQSTINPIECSSYTSPSGNYTWTTSNTYLDTIPNIQGCDSIITINLTINEPSMGTDVINACDVYTWIDGNTYNSDNTTATHTLVGGAINGCDSIVTLNLTINTVDVTTTTNNDSILANATGAVYQWLDCNENYAQIMGASAQQFVATVNGNYAVEVTQNGCTDTSACTTIIGIGLNENDLGLNFSVYPNPTKGPFLIDLGAVQQEVEVLIVNIDGRIISKEYYQEVQTVQSIIEDTAGVYYLHVKGNNWVRIVRVIKI